MSWRVSCWSAVIGCALFVSPPLLGQQASRGLPRDTLPEHLPLDTIPLGLSPRRPVPPDNELTPARVALGRRLFFDGRLSSDGTLSCAGCHDPAHGLASPDPVALGVQGARGRRHSPSLINRAYGNRFFWDGRAASLEEQALLPIENPLELAASVDEVVARLRGDAAYAALFQEAYGEPVSARNLARALASFQRVLLSGNSAVDRFQAKDATALTDSQRQGLWLFESKAGCWRCHSGPNYSDEQFHNTGVSWGREPLDLGRFEVTRKEGDQGAFKTPTLRDVARHPPYMHDGSLATLEEVVEFYSRGGGRNPYLDPALKPLNLTDSERRTLVDFLKALSGRDSVWADRAAAERNAP